MLKKIITKNDLTFQIKSTVLKKKNAKKAHAPESIFGSSQ
jgi:hypothetical protein